MSGLFWSLCWAYTGQFFIVLSLAEMASMAPTAGGQYHWVSEFAPREYQKILSYLSGMFLIDRPASESFCPCFIFSDCCIRVVVGSVLAEHRCP